MGWATSRFRLLLLAVTFCFASRGRRLGDDLIIRPDTNRLGAGNLDEALLTSEWAVGAASLPPRPIGVQFPRLDRVAERRRQNLLFDPRAHFLGEDRERHLDPAEEVPWHPVAARHEHFRVAAVSEEEDARVLEKPVDDR